MQIQLIGPNVRGRSSNVSAQVRQNVFLDVRQRGDKATVAAYGTPGLVQFADFGAEPCRGAYWFQALDMLFIVNRNTLYTVNAIGTYTPVGTLLSSGGRVGMTDNGTELLVVDGPNGYLYTPSTGTFSTISGFPGGSTCCFLDSYFIVNQPNSGQFYISGQYDGATWNALNFATAEANPDNLVAVTTEHGYVALIGEISAELWANTGTLDFPFQRIGGAALEYGLAARWSLARCNGALTGLIKNRRGQLTIAQIDGYNYTSISNSDLDYLINQYPSPSDATGFAYFMGGHEFYQISFAAAGKTWLYDATSQSWSTLKAYGDTRHKADLSVTYRNQVLVTAYDSGKVYRLDPDVYTDDGTLIEREIDLPHTFDANLLNQIVVGLFRLDMEGGVGLYTGQGSNPKVTLQISRDGGHTWGGVMPREIGKLGDGAHRAEWNRLGIARDWVFKIRLTDPVKCAFIGAYIDAQVANK